MYHSFSIRSQCHIPNTGKLWETCSDNKWVLVHTGLAGLKVERLNHALSCLSANVNAQRYIFSHSCMTPLNVSVSHKAKFQSNSKIPILKMHNSSNSGCIIPFLQSCLLQQTKLGVIHACDFMSCFPLVKVIAYLILHHTFILF